MKSLQEFLTESTETNINEAKATAKKMSTACDKLEGQLDAFAGILEDYENDERTLEGKQKDIPVKTLKEFSDAREKIKKIIKDINRAI